MAERGAQDKTEKATPKRRRDARKKGNVAKSKELPSVAVLLGGLLTLSFTAGLIHGNLTSLMASVFSQVGQINLGAGDGSVFFRTVVWGGARVVAPVFAAVLAMALLVNYAQIGALFTLEPIKPKLEKINPIKGLKNIFSMRTLFEAVKNILKLVLVGYIAYLTVKSEWPFLPNLVDFTPYQIVVYVLSTAFKIFLRCCLAILALAIIDYAYQKWQYEKGLRMSKQEVKDEFKQREGDPLVKSRIRSIQRQLASTRMMQAVPEADVVITNPVHLAVALQYVSGQMEAPKVVAKGAETLAERIKEIAAEHGVPIIEDKPLAQTLFKLKLGQVIPVELYEAVAQILAHVYQLRDQAARPAAG